MSVQLNYPQPLGIVDFPAGLQLVTDEADRLELLQGRRRDPQPITEGPIGRYHAWLADPDSADPVEIAAGLPVEVRQLVEVVTYLLGRTDQPPTPSSDSCAEVAALVISTQAAAAVEAAEIDRAARLLHHAADLAEPVSPILAAVMRSNALTVDSDDHRLELAAVLAILDTTDLTQLRAEIRLRLGTWEQQLAGVAADPTLGLRTAMGHYYDALALVSEESSPHLWALLNLNLATAQLAVPMKTASDQLRLGVATMALRSARRVFADQQQLQDWSSASLNLANALVYTPSTHQADNLVEAVELYEEVLASGVRDHDPLGRARLLANLGNVLAHLGVFEHARARLVEARFIFEEHLDHDAAMTVRSVLDEIARSQITDPDDELASLARQTEQMSRMPVESDFTAGMNVTIGASTRISPDATPPPPTTVTILDPATRPTGVGHVRDPQGAP